MTTSQRAGHVTTRFVSTDETANTAREAKHIDSVCCMSSRVLFFFFFVFWVTGELPILRQQEAAADARRT